MKTTFKLSSITQSQTQCIKLYSVINPLDSNFISFQQKVLQNRQKNNKQVGIQKIEETLYVRKV